MNVYLTDDGSTDGTAHAIKEKFPDIKVLTGNGNLYWAGGMRNSWKEALKSNYDGYLLLNDDTNMDRNCFTEFFKTHEFSIKQYGIAGIYIGSTKDPLTQEFTYGGRLLVNKWTYATQNVFPNGTIQKCHLGNSNIMFVHKKVISAIGIFCEKYIHAKADYDYSLRALEEMIPILVLPEYSGNCSMDHKNKPDLSKMNFRERIRYLKSPLGIELSGYMFFMWRFFPWRAPFVYCSLWLKTMIPGLSSPIDRLMQRQN